MKPKFFVAFIYYALLISACTALPTPPAPTSTPTRAALPPVVTRTPDPVSVISPTPTSVLDPIMASVLPAPGTVALDFVALACSATWSSSIVFIPCPGDLTQLENGYITPLTETTIDSGETYLIPSLLTIPPQGENIMGGIFGRYPPLTVQQGDRFRAVLACQPDYPCGEVEYALDFYAEDGSYQQFPTSLHNQFKDYNREQMQVLFVDIPLNFLAGQTVEFTLVIRDQSAILGDRYLWIAPHIYRDPISVRNTPLPPITNDSGGSNNEIDEDAANAMISGFVDMRTAPPYLTDPVTTLGLGVPVVVMFFNQDDGTWWWVHTTNTHPNFRMTVTPGTYIVVAYARGVLDIPYVTGAFTGGEPSCADSVATIKVGPNQQVTDIIITDWCAFNDRPPKPDEVSLP